MNVITTLKTVSSTDKLVLCEHTFESLKINKLVFYLQWRIDGGGNWANAQSKFKTALLKIRLNTTNYELIFSLFIILLFLTEE